MTLILILRDILASLFIGAGLIAIIIGTIGLLRLPDFFSRTHAASLTDSFGAPLVLIGFIILAFPNALTVLHLLAIIALILITSPTATHAIADAANTNHEKTTTP